jgi:AhpD family alkylhydroperoxidase
MTQRLDYTTIAPAGIKALGGVYGYILQSGLPGLLVNLVYLRASQINGCAYCIDMHSRDLIKQGLAVEKLVLVQAWREAGGLFDTRERAALAWAETVTRVADTAVPDTDFQAASAAFSEKELADLTIAIGLMNAYNRLAIGFRVPPKAALSEQQDQIVASKTTWTREDLPRVSRRQQAQAPLNRRFNVTSDDAREGADDAEPRPERQRSER